MSTRGLNKLIGRACISDAFQAALMNGQRAELVQMPEFELEPEERRALLDIQADTFADYGAAVERWLDPRAIRPAWAEAAYRAVVHWPSAASTGVYFRPEH